ncbi:glutamate receptor ionotropic, kainate glr-3-like [Haliotis asinina]|uniref:glutamate receptor ionotropic, kainate glr-3-like n=1 Tax=Haliotis asinina TaxID=109174 RepID=UPI0035320326
MDDRESCAMMRQLILTIVVTFMPEDTIAHEDCPVPALAQSFTNSPQILVFDLSVVDTNKTLQTIHESLFPDIHVVASMSQDHVTELMKTVDSFDAKTKGMTDFRHHSKWLLLHQGTDVPELQALYLENVVLLCHHKCWIQNAFTLRRHSTETDLVPVADCTSRTTMKCYFPNVAYGYNKRHLLVTVLESTMYIVKSVNNGTTRYTGYAIDILDTIADLLNFTYSITEPKDQSWGLPVNNTYDGIVGQLNRTEVDLAACDLTVNEGRSMFIDYIYPPISTEYIDVLYKKHDKQGSSSLYLLVLPLRPNVYLVLVLIAGLCPLLFALFESVDIFLNKTPAESEDVGVCCLMKVKQNLFHSCWEVTGSLFKQGFSKYPSNLPGKVLMTSLWMLLMVITTVYCANLVAALSAQTDVKPFTDLEGLLDSDYSVGIQQHGIEHHILKTNDPSSLYGRLWSKIEANDPVFLESSTENHLKKVEREKYAYLHYTSELEEYMADDCKLEILRERVLFVQQAFGLPKGSPLKPDMENIMSQMSAVGLLDRFWEKWSVKRNRTHCPPKRKLKSVTLNQIGGGFIIVCAGAALGIVVLCLENLTHSVTSIRRTQQ